MSDGVYLVLGLAPVLLIITWWYYSVLQMRRSTNNLTSVLKRNDWKPWKTSREYDVDVQREHTAYRIYNSFLAFLDRHFIIDRGADNERTH